MVLTISAPGMAMDTGQRLRPIQYEWTARPGALQMQPSIIRLSPSIIMPNDYSPLEKYRSNFLTFILPTLVNVRTRAVILFMLVLSCGAFSNT